MKNENSFNCAHANECPVECKCPHDCYCHTQGNCRSIPDGTGLFMVHSVYSVDDKNRKQYPLAYFSTKPLADEFAENHGMGNIQGTWVCTDLAVRVSDDVVYIITDVPVTIDGETKRARERHRAAAIKKLNKFELAALGLKQ